MNKKLVKISIGILGLLVIMPSLFLHGNKTSEASSKNQKIINAILNDFHDAAAKADEKRYMGHLAEEAIFMGTDAEERWTKKEFQKYVHRFFSNGSGWTYVGRDRLIKFNSNGNVAWFSERLFNKKYGELRGSGVLSKVRGQWKIFQYNMVFVIPNQVAGDVVKRITRFKKSQE